MDEAVKILRDNQSEVAVPIVTTTSHSTTASQPDYQDNLASQANLPHQPSTGSSYRPNLGTS
jgi:hypothetical protein